MSISSTGDIYLFHSKRHPIICLNHEGKFLRSWGDKFIRVAHGDRMADAVRYSGAVTIELSYEDSDSCYDGRVLVDDHPSARGLFGGFDPMPTVRQPRLRPAISEKATGGRGPCMRRSQPQKRGSGTSPPAR